ncbi:TonB-dependent receptor [Desulfosarcina ovata]|uniref:TonB-dependent receptor n=1 Tax=Desulfosarcina ovata subsp. ovata TaxID=2752305 RepID=A0A5K8AL93_9BACT|nr:TonB-dependent receptor [Desulfosarcina ovata]BBO93398.1 TonB-dependent receptor [Desulfosarcina ovata subsp. ovata]
MEKRTYGHSSGPIHTFLLLATLFSITAQSHAEEAAHSETTVQTLLPVYVIEKQDATTTIIPSESAVGTEEIIGKKTIDIQGGAEQLNPYKAISMQPGVDIRSNDAFGMDVSHRIRGKSDRNIGETVEGLPVKGIGPGGGLSTMIDLENIESISLSKGAVTADSGFGYGSDNGMVDMHVRQPADESHGTAKQVLGSDAFTRSFIRLDSGQMGRVAKMFVSGSYTEADKWKGSGDSPDGRKNVAVGLSGTADQPIQWELYGMYNKNKRHSYRGLSYEQTRDLSANKDFDYNSSLTGDSATDAYYYDYNRLNFETSTVFGKIAVPFNERCSLTIKPYYLHDRGTWYLGSSGKVIDWSVDHDTMGGVIEYRRAIDRGEIKAGYWYQEDEAPGPPTSRKYRSTDDLAFLGWERLVEVDNHKFSSPFVTAEKTIGATTLVAGLRYLWLTQPDLTSYDVTGLPDVDYDDALALDPDVQLHVDGQTHEIFLPNIGITHLFQETLQLRASYGRTYNTPQYSLGKQITALQAKGLSDTELQAIWDSIEPETGDNFDLGLNYTFGRGFISPTLFYSLVKNVGGSFYDPDLELTYTRNSAEAQSYGVELAAGCTLTPELNLSAAVTYTQYEFTSDIEAAGGSTIESEGHQIPNVPEWMVNLSLNWEKNGYRVAPTVRYLGERYVDVENKYSLGAYFLVDLALSKTFKLTPKQALTVSLSVTNLLDKEYISDISASDASIGQDTTYTVGAPQTFFIALQYDI